MNILNETNQVLVIEVLNWRLPNIDQGMNLGQITRLSLTLN